MPATRRRRLDPDDLAVELAPEVAQLCLLDVVPTRTKNVTAKRSLSAASLAATTWYEYVRGGQGT